MGCAKQTAHPDFFSSDATRDTIDKLLDGKIGQPFDSKKLDQIYDDGKKRYEKFRPPGYKDRSKEAKAEKHRFYVNGAEAKREFGDLISWRQIIEHAKEKQIKHLIFVTDDDKEDWWREENFKGTRDKGPRREPIHEIMTDAEVEMFHMYNNDMFMKYVRQHLGLPIREESIQEAKDIRITRQQSDETPEELRRREIIAAVARHLANANPGSISQSIDAGPNDGIHVLVKDRQGAKGYLVIPVDGPPSELAVYVYPGLRGRLRITELYGIENPKTVIVIVQYDAEWNKEIQKLQQSISADLNEKLIIGILTNIGPAGGPPFSFLRLA